MAATAMHRLINYDNTAEASARACAPRAHLPPAGVHRCGRCRKSLIVLLSCGCGNAQINLDCLFRTPEHTHTHGTHTYRNSRNQFEHLRASRRRRHRLSARARAQTFGAPDSRIRTSQFHILLCVRRCRTEHILFMLSDGSARVRAVLSIWQLDMYKCVGG